MLLLEIAAQGVRGFAPSGGRVGLRAGYNVISCDGATLRRLVAALLHTDRPVDPALRAEGSAAGAAVRAGLTLAGDDGVTWRVVRDLAGPCQLQRYDPERRAFQSIARDPAQIAAVLRAAGAPGPERLSLVLTIAASGFPSRQGGTGLPGVTSALAGIPPAPPPRRPPGAPVAAPQAGGSRTRLEALRRELEQARRAEELQLKLDALQSRLFKLEEALKSGDQVQDRVRTARAAVEALARGEEALAALGDAPARLAAAARAASRRDEALEKVAEERGEALAEPRKMLVPFWLQPMFLAGAGLGAASMLAGLVSPWRWLALLAIPATGLAAFDGLRWVGRAEELQTDERRVRWLAERERKAREAWDRETADVRAAMAAAGVASVAEANDLLERVREARATLADAEAGLAAWAAAAETQDAGAERARVQQEIGELERQITGGGGGFVRDPTSLAAEIARLEREGDEGGGPGAEGAEGVAGSTAGALDPAIGAPGGFVIGGPVGAPLGLVDPLDPLAGIEPGPGVPAAPAPASGEPLRELVARASAELGLGVGAALRALQPRVVQLLPLLSNQRLTSFFVDERGNVQVQAGGRLVPSGSLQPGERDVCYAVLKLGFAEQGLAAGKAVALLDDAFASLPEGARRILARALKQVARGRQVVHGTTDPIFREAADHAG